MNMKQNFLLVLALAVLVFSATAVSAAISDGDYLELNKVLNVINDWSLGELSETTDGENLINFAANISIHRNDNGEYSAQASNDWGEIASKKAVEAILNRYFGVEKINHEKSELYRSMPEWDVDYPLDGLGDVPGYWWINVAELEDAGDGTFMAKTNVYFSDVHWDDSWRGPVSQWKLESGLKIIETDIETFLNEFYEEPSEDIYRYDSCLIKVKPIVFKGESTWQVLGINGVEAPKVLFEQ